MKIKIIIVFLVLFYGCTSNTIMKKPDDLIQKKDMIDIMTDIYIANAAFNVRNKYEERHRNYLSLIYEKYGIDSARFSHSNLYYISRIDEYEKMHEKVLENITKIKVEKEAEFKIYDSIKRAKAN